MSFLFPFENNSMICQKMILACLFAKILHLSGSKVHKTFSCKRSTSDVLWVWTYAGPLLLSLSSGVLLGCVLRRACTLCEEHSKVLGVVLKPKTQVRVTPRTGPHIVPGNDNLTLLLMCVCVQTISLWENFARQTNWNADWQLHSLFVCAAQPLRLDWLCLCLLERDVLWHVFCFSKSLFVAQCPQLATSTVGWMD